MVCSIPNQGSQEECLKCCCLYTVPLDSCLGINCGPGRHCVSSGSAALCQCDSHCPISDLPLCAANNVTYKSKCHLDYASCRSGVRLRIAHRGSCSMLSHFSVIHVLELYRSSCYCFQTTAAMQTAQNARSVLREMGVPGVYALVMAVSEILLRRKLSVVPMERVT